LPAGIEAHLTPGQFDAVLVLVIDGAAHPVEN
jgi:hypothetical protein